MTDQFSLFFRPGETDQTKQLFRDVGETWRMSRVGRRSEATLDDYASHLVQLNRYFGEMRLCDITPRHVRAYQELRQQKVWDEDRGQHRGAGPSRINHEIGTLAEVLKTVNLWHPIESFYEPLRAPYAQAPRAIEPQEEQRLFHVAGQRPEWARVYWAATLMVNTTMGAGELRKLRLCDFDLQEPSVRVERDAAKNKYRVRAIPLNRYALEAARQLLELAYAAGARRPEHFVFPFRIKRNLYDPTRPMTKWGLRRAWTEVREAAGLPSMRMYDLRHQAITKLAEGGNSDQVIMSIAGHVSRQMLEHYSHIRMQAKKEALDSIATKPVGRVLPMPASKRRSR